MVVDKLVDRGIPTIQPAEATPRYEFHAGTLRSLRHVTPRFTSPNCSHCCALSVAAGMAAAGDSANQQTEIPTSIEVYGKASRFDLELEVGWFIFGFQTRLSLHCLN